MAVRLLPDTSGLPSTYDVSTRLLDEHLARTHAVRRRAARLDANSDRDTDVGGVVALRGAWSVEPG